MCTRTERRYAQQPLTVCSAFQPSSMVDLEIEHRTTSKFVTMYSLKFINIAHQYLKRTR